jgi:hypothetical protein
MRFPRNRISGGKVEEKWNYFDQLGLLQQLGVVPAPETGQRVVIR